MDQRLYDAARTGDVDALDALQNADPLILNKIFLSHFAETPLHVATLAGQTKFAKKIITLMPSFARELNRDGFAPMHMASARGDEEIVTELLKLDTGCSLCLQRDNSGQIPLHYAVVRGRIPVIEKLISHCSESLQEVTALGETVLHLAVKNSQFEALKVLLERLKGLECLETLLSTKDNKGKGKTIVELAKASKQVQVLNLLKKYQNGHTNNNEILEFAADKQDDIHQIDIFSNSETDDKQESEGKRKKQPSQLEMDNLMLVALVLIATVTYQAAVTPPSGIWEKGVNLNAKCLRKNYHWKDFSFQKIKQDCPAYMFYIFLICNSAGFYSSVFLILMVAGSYDNYRMQLLSTSIGLLALNYIALITGLTPDVSSLFVAALVPEVLVVLLLYSTKFVIRFMKKGKWRILKWARKSKAEEAS